MAEGALDAGAGLHGNTRLYPALLAHPDLQQYLTG